MTERLKVEMRKYQLRNDWLITPQRSRFEVIRYQILRHMTIAKTIDQPVGLPGDDIRLMPPNWSDHPLPTGYWMKQGAVSWTMRNRHIDCTGEAPVLIHPGHVEWTDAGVDR